MKKKSGFVRVILAIDKVMSKIEAVFCMSTLFIMMALVFFGVISRFILHLSIMWTEEVSIYTMCACVFIGVSMAYRERAHVGLTGLIDLLPEKVGKVFLYFRHIFCIASVGICTYYSFNYVKSVKMFGQKTAALRWPMYIVYIPIVVGLAMTFIRSIMIFWNDVLLKDPVLEDQEDEVLAN